MIGKDNIIVKLSGYGDSLGPREIGKEIRESVSPQLKEGNNVFFSFRDVHLISSGFADELFGMLFVELGEERFKNQIKLNDFNDEKERDFVIKAIKNSLEFRKKQSA
jgi:hypothetical protein